MSNTYLGGGAATFIARVHTSALIKLEVNFADGVDASAYFIQLHDSPILPAAASVPLKVWPAAEVAYKEFKRGELGFAKGCVLVVSSTRLTYTAQATNIAQVQMEFADVDNPSGYTTASALVNQSLIAFDGTTLYAVYQCRIVNPAALTVPTWAQFYALNGGSAVQFGSLKMVAGQIGIASFGGNAGYYPSLKTTAGILCQGFGIIMAIAAWGGNISADNFDLYADYK